MTLTPAEYKATQDRLELLARLALDTDPDVLEAFIRQAEHADTVGAFLDPTAWMRGQTALKFVIVHARALAAFRRAVAS